VLVSDDNRWLRRQRGWHRRSLVLQFKGDASVATSSPRRYRTHPDTRKHAAGIDGRAAGKDGDPSFESCGVSAEIADIMLSSVSECLANFDYITLCRAETDRDDPERAAVPAERTDGGGRSERSERSSKDLVLLGSVGKLAAVWSSPPASFRSRPKVLKGREVICEDAATRYLRRHQHAGVDDRTELCWRVDDSRITMSGTHVHEENRVVFEGSARKIVCARICSSHRTGHDSTMCAFLWIIR
jgi:hypothetical protein